MTTTDHAAQGETLLTDALKVAQDFHDTYERLAPQFGYETRKDTKKFDAESPNGRLMVAVCGQVLERANAELRQEVERITAQLADAQRERDEARNDYAEAHALAMRLGDILTGVANALKGDPKPLHMHGYTDLPKLAAAARKDGERLDWLLKESYVMFPREARDATIHESAALVFTMPEGRGSMNRDRAAIDAAITANRDAP